MNAISNFPKALDDLTDDYFSDVELLSAVEYVITAARPYLVKGMLLSEQVSLLCGSPNTGKTAVAAALCSHIALGKDIGTHRVKKGGVFYVAAEDHVGVLERANPYLKDSGADRNSFLVSPKPIDLRSRKQVNSLIRGLGAWMTDSAHEVGIVVFDTMNLSLGDGDENSTRDMSAVMSNAQLIARKAKVHVMIVAHVSSSDKDRPRGSSVMVGNSDTVLILKNADEANVVYTSPTKQRSMRKADTTFYEITCETVGVDEDGDEITVAKAVPLAGDDRFELSIADEKRSKHSLNALREQDILATLRRLSARGADSLIDRLTIEAECGKAFDSVRSKQDSLKKKVREALAALEEAGEVLQPSKGKYCLNRAATRPEDL